MNSNPLVSVIIPTFNSAQFLFESIYSIVNQSYRNLEIIVVDDTPKDDGTRDILNSFNDNRIIYVKPETRFGMVKSLNYAISLSHGEYIARMDADDISHKNRIKRQVEYLNKHSEVGVLGCNCYTINKEGKIIGCLSHPQEDSDIKSKMMFNVAFIHPSVIIRKELLADNPYNEDCICCEDYELWSRLMSKTEFHNLKQRLFKYRILSDGAMQSQLKKLQDDDVYYKKHTDILKLAYDRVLSFYGVNGKNINSHYVDLTFSKRITMFNLSERESFLSSYEALIRTKNNSKYVKRCISYQWIKMTKTKFWKTKRIEWLFGGIEEGVIAIFEKFVALARRLNHNSDVFEWKL